MFLACIALGIFSGTLFFVLLTISDKKTQKEKMKVYLDIMRNSDCIIDDLLRVQDALPQKCPEWNAINKALHYLEFSILRDYATGFAIIEKAFRQKEIKIVHQALLEKEQNKVLYLLTH